MDRFTEILELLASPGDLTDEQIGELEVELIALFDEAVAGDTTPELVEMLSQIADAVDGLRALAGQRIEEAEAAATAEAEAAAAAAAAVAEMQRRVSGEPEATEGDEPEASTEDEPAVEVEPELEPVTAASDTPPPAPAPAPAPATRPLGTIQPPARFNARPAAARPTVRMFAAGTGHEFSDRVAVEDALLQAFDDTRGAGFLGDRRVAQFRADYPEARRLRPGRINDVTDQAAEIRAAAMSGAQEQLQALTADGGLCAPTQAWYDLQTIAQAGRPLRDSLPGFDAGRGGIRFSAPMSLSDIGVGSGGSPSQAIGFMTEAQDAAGQTNKTYQMIECGDEVEVKVDIAWNQLQIGNLVARTNPERVSQFTDLSVAAFARANEQRLWASLVALSTDLNAPQALGATRDLLAGLNRSAINYRARHRMPINAPVEVRLPAWVGMGLLPDDQANALQSYEDQFSVTVAKVEQWLAERNIRVANWFEDDFTTAVTATGSINAYPTAFKVIMSHPGAFVYVDGGELNIGVHRDGTMINDNVYRTFGEEFWNVAMWGLEALAIEFSLCASGASAGSVEPECGS